MALAGAVLGGRYVLDEQIGSGGYGEVWRAADTVLSRPVAVKLLHPRYTQRSEALDRFRAEARHAGGLSHENIAQVFDYVEPADGQPPYLVMELVDGPSLETVLAGGPPRSRCGPACCAMASAWPTSRCGRTSPASRTPRACSSAARASPMPASR